MALRVMKIIFEMLVQGIFGTNTTITTFQIHDDTPDWFLEYVNKRLDKLLGDTNASLSR